jgi:hypothetical protein
MNTVAKNQISENIVCNSDYYNIIYDNNVNNFEQNMMYIADKVNEFIANNIYNAAKYLNINTHDINLEKNRKNILIYCKYKINREPLLCHNCYLNIEYQYEYDFYTNATLNIGDYFENIHCSPGIINSKTNDKVTIKTTSRKLFHFSFHSKKSHRDKNTLLCVEPPRKNRIKGAFHIIIDSMMRKYINNNEVYYDISPISKCAFRPFILNYKNMKFMNFRDIESPNNYFSSTSAKIDELQNGLIRLSNDNYVVINNDVNYITQIVEKIYNIIVNNLNVYMSNVIIHGIIHVPVKYNRNKRIQSCIENVSTRRIHIAGNGKTRRVKKIDKK